MLSAIIYIWPFAQKCFECRSGVECQDTDNGTLTGISSQPFAVCARSITTNDGCNCESFVGKAEDE